MLNRSGQPQIRKLGPAHSLVRLLATLEHTPGAWHLLQNPLNWSLSDAVGLHCRARQSNLTLWGPTCRYMCKNMVRTFRRGAQLNQ